MNESMNRIKLIYDEVNKCVQCGYCLPVCPTYQSMGRESASPRGRINLVKLAAEGKIDTLADLAGPLELCLGCRACEVACPVGVEYGRILEQGKTAIAEAESGGGSVPARSMRGQKLSRLLLKRLFPYPGRLRLAGNLLYAYQKTGMNKLIRASRMLPRVSRPAAAFEKVMPAMESPHKRITPGSIISAKGEKKASVAFFSGCIMDAVMSRTNRLTVELLAIAGCEVAIPQAQVCCGALHAHQGMREQAKELAKANIAAFERTHADYYVNNAGGCGAMLKEYGELLKDDREWSERAAQFAERTRDVTEILYEFGPLPFAKPWHGTITYQDSCHLRNVQGVIDPPRALLRSIPGAVFVELSEADQCCASGGIYNLQHFHESMAILDVKMEHVKNTSADILVTTNPGCLLQMRLGIERSRDQAAAVKMEARHIIDVLAEACGIS